MQFFNFCQQDRPKLQRIDFPILVKPKEIEIPEQIPQNNHSKRNKPRPQITKERRHSNGQPKAEQVVIRFPNNLILIIY